MNALAQFNAIKQTQGSPADQQALLQNIMRMHGSATGFYRAAAKEMGTTPDHVMEEIEKLGQQQPMQQQPQSAGLAGANANTAVPQTMNPPTQLNATKMDNSVRGMEGQGVGTAQAVNQAAQNPQNGYAKGGPVPPPPDKPTLDAELAKTSAPDDLINAVRGMAVTRDMPASSSSTVVPAHKPVQDSTEQMFRDYESKDQYPQPKTSGPMAKGQDATRHGVGYAKGGPVHESIKNMSLKDIIKLLASHPELAGSGQDNGDNSLQGQPGGVGMASGGQLEADSITSYGPDGTPIVQNADGTQGYGDINQLLGRPESASTLGTGATPTSRTSKSVANNIGNSQASNSTTMMAKGGEDAPPPGALSEEVADNVPAQLSPGEFVFSADSTRYYGLKTLTALQDHARQQLSGMEGQGKIRSPGDGKNPPDDGSFMQDQKPNMNAYSQHQEPDGDEDDSTVSGILKECMGGANYSQGGAVDNCDMATGGGIAEEQSLSKGGPVSSSTKGSLMNYARGGVVTSSSSNLFPKKSESLVPTQQVKSGMVTKGGSVGKIPSVKTIQPKLAKGGLINQKRDINQTQSTIG